MNHKKYNMTKSEFDEMIQSMSNEELKEFQLNYVNSEIESTNTKMKMSLVLSIITFLMIFVLPLNVITIVFGVSTLFFIIHYFYVKNSNKALIKFKEVIHDFFVENGI